MTRKDYKLITDRLNELCDDLGKHNLDFSRFISRLCADLQQDNQNFDSAKFREKVYGK